MKKKILRFTPFIFFFFLVLFLFKPLFHSHFPIPLDGLVGSYFPWLDYKFGYPVGVPVKNISLTDVFSQLYPWRLLSVHALASGQLPLWNPFTFLGTPLLANWQSAPFYPLNFLVLLLGDLWGWSLLILLQPILSLSFMYLYLRQLKLKKTSAVLGSLIFAFSGFMLTYLEYGTTGQIFLWLPLQLYLIDKFFHSQQPKFLLFASLIFFPVITAGFFQPAFYLGLVVSLYYFFRLLTSSFSRSKHHWFWGLLFLLLGVALGAIQLLPTFEFASLSIRNQDHNIVSYQYGLLPVRNLITLIAPDFFGHPSTQNFWGFMQYQETYGYFSLVALVLIVSLLLVKKKKPLLKFFFSLFFLSLILAYRNPLSLLVYQFKIPALSTGYASRWYLITSFSAAVLAAFSLDHFRQSKKHLRSALYLLSILLPLIALVFSFRFLLQHTGLPLDDQIMLNLNTAFRNSAIPLFLLLLFILSSRFISKPKLFSLIVISLVTFDLSRSFIKFTPFSPASLTQLSTPTTDFLQENQQLYRLDTERGPLLPSNSTLYFDLSTPSGYDPLIYQPYASWYQIYTQPGKQLDAQELAEGNKTRYLSLQEYTSPFLDLAGVKYLLALKRTDIDEFRPYGQSINKNIPTDKFTQVFDDGTTVVLENQSVMPRVILYDSFQIEPDQYVAQEMVHSQIDFRQTVVLDQSPSNADLSLSQDDSATITHYSLNQVNISTQTQSPTILVLTDTNYPGWQVTIDGQQTDLLTAHGIFRAVELPAGEHQVVFTFKPKSFFYGVIISSATLLFILFLLLKSHFGGNKMRGIRDDVRTFYIYPVIVYNHPHKN